MYKVMRKRAAENGNPNGPWEVGKFKSEGDALWCATVFAAHKGFSGWIHWVQKGKKVWYPATAINPEYFNLISI